MRFRKNRRNKQNEQVATTDIVVVLYTEFKNEITYYSSTKFSINSDLIEYDNNNYKLINGNIFLIWKKMIGLLEQLTSSTTYIIKIFKINGDKEIFYNRNDY